MGRLEWNRTVERDRDVLERILSLLLALAALTERAAGLPAVDRLPVLAILGHGEAEARSLILAMACGAPVEPAAAPSPAAGDAGRLAASFRMLALAMSAMLAQARARFRHASPPASMPGREPHRSAPRIPPPTPRATSPPAPEVKSAPVLSSGQGERWRRAAATERGCFREAIPSRLPD